MSTKPKILAFAGSTREGSFNKKLLNDAAAGAAAEGAEVTVIDLADYPLPLYDGDIEKKSGVPENARKLQMLFAEHDGFIIASPEYNGSFSGTLKNVFDWVSRKDTTLESPVEPFKGKVAATLSASPGARGGLKGLAHLRDVLDHLQVMVVPEIFSVGSAAAAFNDAGRIKDPKTAKAVQDVGAAVARTAKKMKA